MAKKFFRKIGKGVRKAGKYSRKVARNPKVRRFVVGVAKKAARSPAIRGMVVGKVRKIGGPVVGKFAAEELDKQLRKV